MLDLAIDLGELYFLSLKSGLLDENLMTLDAKLLATSRKEASRSVRLGLETNKIMIISSLE